MTILYFESHREYISKTITIEKHHPFASHQYLKYGQNLAYYLFRIYVFLIKKHLKYL